MNTNARQILCDSWNYHLIDRKRLLSGLRYVVTSNLVINEMIFGECIALWYTFFSIFRKKQSAVELFDIILKRFIKRIL